MACYVDNLMNHGWRLGPSCHLIADSDTELYQLAGQIGLRREWVQKHRRFGLHFDLTSSRRQEAVAQGAVELGRREFVSKLRERIDNGP